MLEPMDDTKAISGGNPPVRLAEGVYWVGHRFAEGKTPYSAEIPMDCNPYLIVDGDEAVLVDPGSPIDFDFVLRSVSSLVQPDAISLIVAHHQDPDICAALPLLAKAGITAPVAMHWRASLLARHYGSPHEFYVVNERGWEWRFRSGRILRFLPAPYCHCAGCIMTWDATSHTLFSSDVFGSIIHSPDLFAGPDYDSGMRAFHEHYMPSREVLAPVMESLLPLDIATIAPQHGCVIADDIRKRILALRELECGTFIDSIGEEYPARAFSPAAVAAGPSAASRRSTDTAVTGIRRNDPPKRESIESKAGLLDASAFRDRLAAALSGGETDKPGVLYFSVDNLEEINQLYGRPAGDEALAALAYIIRNSAHQGDDWSYYMLDRPYIACVAEGITPAEARAMAERVRNHAASSVYGEEELTVSVAILHSAEFGTGDADTPDGIDRALLARLFRAKKTRSGGICDRVGNGDADLYLRKKILLIEPDDAYVRFLSPFFESRGYFLMTMRDGSDATSNADQQRPDLIIAEAMAPRVSGFDLRERMIASGEGRDIPFILVSRRKDETFIRRAIDLGIVHFLKKPFSKTELLGLVDNLLGTVT